MSKNKIDELPVSKNIKAAIVVWGSNSTGSTQKEKYIACQNPNNPDEVGFAFAKYFEGSDIENVVPFSLSANPAV